jgi:hypothetical protein
MQISRPQSCCTDFSPFHPYFAPRRKGLPKLRLADTNSAQRFAAGRVSPTIQRNRPADGRPMGMSDQIWPVFVLPPEGKPRMAGVSDSLLDAGDQEARRIVDECARRAEQLLEENRSRLDNIAEQLLLYETLDEADPYAAAGVERVLQS